MILSYSKAYSSKDSVKKMDPTMCDRVVFGLVWMGQLVAHRFWIAIGKRKD